MICYLNCQLECFRDDGTRISGSQTYTWSVTTTHFGRRWQRLLSKVIVIPIAGTSLFTEIDFYYQPKPAGVTILLALPWIELKPKLYWNGFKNGGFGL